MKSKLIKIIALFVGIGIVVAAGLGLYFSFNYGPVAGEIDFDTEYHLSEFHPTDKFKGAIMNKDSYFKINADKTTGTLYLVGLEATTDPIPFIVTKYKESNKYTEIFFEYIINNGNDTSIQHLKAISTTNQIIIKSIEAHSVKDIIQQNPEDISELEYEVDILIFTKEAA